MNLSWIREYKPQWLAEDLRIAIFATLILIPQALAYAALAGLPPYFGLYASMLPLVVYALFGSSPVLSVGPVAIISLMTASALGPLALDSSQYIQAAALLTLISGVILLLFAALRLGALANLLSQPVISGFISGAAVLIIISQLQALLGVQATGNNALMMLYEIMNKLSLLQPLTAGLGLGSLLILLLGKLYVADLLRHLGMQAKTALLISRSLPMLLVVISGALVFGFQWQNTVAVIGKVPQGLPTISFNGDIVKIAPQLLLPALFIALIGFVQSIAIARVAATKQRQTVNPNKELMGLGAANLSSALVGGIPVFGSFARTAITMEGGSNSPVANFITAIIVAFILLWGSSLLTYLPISVLAATIIMAVFNLIDTATLRKTWQHNRSDALALIVTFIAVLVADIEIGIITGMGLSLFSVIWRASYPYIAILGRIPGTTHYRNVLHYNTENQSDTLLLRIDENLFFGNAQVIEQRIQQEWREKQPLKHLVLVMSSVSHIDSTALDMLEKLNADISEQGGFLHLAELKNIIRTPLKDSKLMHDLSGKIFLTTADADEYLHS